MSEDAGPVCASPASFTHTQTRKPASQSRSLLACDGGACYKPALFEGSSGVLDQAPVPPIPCTRLPGAAAVSGHEGEVMANDVSTLTAQKRDQAGKGPSHRLRAKGMIPAVCYGP